MHAVMVVGKRDRKITKEMDSVWERGYKEREVTEGKLYHQAVEGLIGVHWGRKWERAFQVKEIASAEAWSIWGSTGVWYSCRIKPKGTSGGNDPGDMGESPVRKGFTCYAVELRVAIIGIGEPLRDLK